MEILKFEPFHSCDLDLGQMILTKIKERSNLPNKLEDCHRTVLKIYITAMTLNLKPTVLKIYFTAMTLNLKPWYSNLTKILWWPTNDPKNEVTNQFKNNQLETQTIYRNTDILTCVNVENTSAILISFSAIRILLQGLLSGFKK